MTTVIDDAVRSARPIMPKRPSRGSNFWFRSQGGLLSLLGILIVLVAWQICASTNVVNPTFSSSPIDIAKAEYTIFQDGSIWSTLGKTGWELLIGLLIIIVGGIPLGLIIGASNTLYHLSRGMIDILYSVPFVLFLPIIIFWFGIDNESRIVLVIWSGILPLMMNTIAGVRSLDRDYSRVAKVFCTPRTVYFLRVAMPATIPYILSGVRLAIGRALVGAIVAEFFMGSGGLGFFVQQQAAQFNTAESMAGIVILAVVAIVLNNIVGGLYRRYALWAEPQ
jgi:ABC-type nitrate/sulfonate/bicarbonate transport system permease component